ncbi:hypothetical protein RT97_28310 [Variovorax paradoxus]|uniref:Uncharacterized protein n=1 Tax=Variovorax paradoxus TaxID=34073 RepID=A0A0D0LSQ9_VARPD|nr:hypothetical protein [Variovorax paradoxus]KIQ20555.1 hypothetical protein RT97_28310 [Variovorax paradoxus]
MTNFILTLSTGTQKVAATKYKTAPRSAPFVATLDGKPADAWTTEGRGSAYIYFKDGATLYYVKVLATDTVAAKTSLVIETEGYTPKVAKPKTTNSRTRKVVKA